MATSLNISVYEELHVYPLESLCLCKGLGVVMKSAVTNVSQGRVVKVVVKNFL